MESKTQTLPKQDIYCTRKAKLIQEKLYIAPDLNTFEDILSGSYCELDVIL